jgi:hypothetical protein
MQGSIIVRNKKGRQMKDKINKLIDRQLGALPEAGTPNHELIKFAEKLHGWVVGSKFEANDIIEKEKEFRALLAALIEYAYHEYATFKIGSFNMQVFLDNYKIELIEKSISLPWAKIIKYLESINETINTKT